MKPMNINLRVRHTK